ncbi:Aldo/keto reductase [Pluteus cervinus]|uniref:Aldo/keto reductase n=1 Tax=Pluteus cervinus TaxID=181527 RepID=A0ACD3B1A9_9AGAR|nr:Aldo/keto reductase [Pluteus cervinus]
MSQTGRTIELNNGIHVPIIGCGAWAPDTPEEQAKVKGWIGTALKAGYRHIDTALGYGTEAAVGEAVRASGIPREQIFITTKLPWNHHDRVKESFEASLKNLDIDYIDLYLVHWPQFIPQGDDLNNPGPLPKNPDGTIETSDKVTFNDSWAEVEKLLETGKVKAVGVSNFSIKTLEQLFKTTKIVRAVNQVELHPYLVQSELVEYCKEKKIAVTAYSPSGWSAVRGDPVIVEIAQKYNATPTQVILAWHLANDVIVIPKSVDEGRQKENLQLPVLEEADVLKITQLDRNQRICNKGDENNQVYGWTLEQLGW